MVGFLHSEILRRFARNYLISCYETCKNINQFLSQHFDYLHLILDVFNFQSGWILNASFASRIYILLMTAYWADIFSREMSTLHDETTFSHSRKVKVDL